MIPRPAFFCKYCSQRILMPKLTQKTIREKSDEYAGLMAKIENLKTAKNKKINPLLVELNEKTKPIEEEYARKIAPLQVKADALEIEVLAAVTLIGKPIAIDTKRAIAELKTIVGDRAVDPQTFYEAAVHKGAAVWECFKVQLAKADKLLGKKQVDALAKKDEKLEASLTLKPKQKNNP